MAYTLSWGPPLKERVPGTKSPPWPCASLSERLANAMAFNESPYRAGDQWSAGWDEVTAVILGLLRSVSRRAYSRSDDYPDLPLRAISAYRNVRKR